jgi:hypothetical protein
MLYAAPGTAGAKIAYKARYETSSMANGSPR